MQNCHSDQSPKCKIGYEFISLTTNASALILRFRNARNVDDKG